MAAASLAALATPDTIFGHGSTRGTTQDHPMHPKPLYRHRRRWTLFFSVPFALLLLAAFGYCLFLPFAADDRLVKIIGGGGAFVAFCAGGTFGKTVLAALWDLGPAVVAVDSAGLDDRRGGTGLVSWRDIESVKLDDAASSNRFW